MQKNLKDISFINHMPELAHLEITDSRILLLDPLLRERESERACTCG